MTGRVALSAGRMFPGLIKLALPRSLPGGLSVLDYLELYRIPFLQSAVAIPYDSGIMNKNIWTIFAPDEAIPFRVVKPFHGSLHLCSPPGGDLDVSRGRLNRDACSRQRHILRGVYQNDAFSQERNHICCTRKFTDNRL